MNRVKATQEEIDSLDAGACRSCGTKYRGIEPDTRNEGCAACGKLEVYDLAELQRRDELEVYNSNASD